MAARKKQTRARSRKRPARARPAPQATLVDNVQQIWLAGVGAISRAQKEGPAAFQDAVAEGLKLLERSRANAEQAIREALGSAQGSVQTRFGSARDQATETWDNLEALFQNRVRKALHQLGVPSRDEIRLLTKRVAELNDSVQALSARQARARRKAPAKKSRARAKSAR